MILPDNKLLTIHEAAEKLGVSTKTLRRWEAAGHLIPQRTVGNQRRYTVEEIQNFKHPSVIARNEPKANDAAISAQSYGEIASSSRFTSGLSRNDVTHFPSVSETIKEWEAKNPKSEIRNSKQFSKYEFSNDQKRFEHLDFGHSNLFRISRFDIRILLRPNAFTIFLLSAVLGLGLFKISPSPYPTSSQIEAELYPNGKLASTDVPLRGYETGEVLAAKIAKPNFIFNVNVPSTFSDILTVKGNLTAPNVIYSVKPGTGVTVSEGQNPIVGLKLEAGSGITVDGAKISNSGIVSLTAGTGMTVSGSTITNADPGTSQKIFKTIAVDGQTSVVAGTNTDTLTFASGTGVVLTTNPTTKTVTIAGDGAQLNVSGWGRNTTDGFVYLGTQTDSVGIGTSSPSYKLDVSGNINATGDFYNDGVLVSGLIWATSGNDAYTINTGNIGIGTSSPSSKLDIAGSLNLSTGNNFTIAGNSVLNTTTLGSSVLNSSLTTVGALSSGSITNGFGTIFTTQNMGTTANLGVGTTNPLSPLDVNSNFNVFSNGRVGVGNTNPTSQFSVGDHSDFTVDGTGAVVARLFNGVTIATGSGTLNLANTFNTSGNYSLTLTQTGATNVTLPPTGTLLTNTVTSNQTITSTQQSSTIFGLTDTTNISGTITGQSITLSGTGAYDQTGLAFNLSGASGTNLNDIVGSGSTWKVSTTGDATFNSLSVNNISGPTITSSNTFRASDGSAATPSYSFTNNTDTGLFNRSGALGIGSSGTERMVILTNGNVGIGTTNPSSALEIAGQIKITGGSPGSSKVLSSDANGLASWVSITGAGGVGGSGAAGYLSRWNDTNNLTSSVLYDDGSNVGIGTTAPSSTFSVGASSQFQINSTGNIVKINNVTTNFPNSQGAAGSILSNDGSGNLSWGDITGSGSIGFWTRSGTRLYPTNTSDNVTVAGNLGVGTTSPEAVLDVLGNAWLRGTGSGGVFVNGNVGIGTTNPLGFFSVGASSQFQVSSTGAVTAPSFNGNTLTTGTGTLTLAAGKTALFADDFSTSGAFPLVLTTTAATNVTLPATGTLLTNTASANQTVTSSQTSGTVLGLTDTTNITGALIGQAITLSGTGVYDQTGLQFNLSGASGTNLNDIVGSSSTWKVSTTGAATFASVTASGASGTQGWWQRNGTTVSPTTLTDNIGIGTTGATALLHVYSTSTSTSFIGQTIDWQPTASTTTTGDLLYLNVGGSGVLNSLLNIADNGSSVFSVSQTQIVSALPHSFTSAGDVSISYDLVFTNPTASNIKSDAPLSIVSGEVFNSSDLTLSTYNAGNLILNSANLWADGSNVGIGMTNPAGMLQIGSSAANSVLITSAGRVGIGTTNPTYDLDIARTLGVGGTAYFGGNVGIGTTSPLAQLQINHPNSAKAVSILNTSNSNTETFALTTNSNNAFFRMFNSSGVETISLNAGTSNSFINAGNVGIGTTSPVGPLHVVASATPAFVVTSAGNIGIGTTGPGQRLHLYASTGGAVSLTEAADGYAVARYKNAGTGYEFFAGIQKNAGDIFTTDGLANAGVFATQSNIPIQFATNNAARMTILGTGNVGIGTTGPTAQLHLTKADSSGASDILVNPSAKTSGNLLDLQLAGNNRFSVNYVGSVSMSGNLVSSGRVQSGISDPGTSGAFIWGPTITTTSSQVGLKISPTYNQASGTAANTDLLINRIETTLGSGTQYLIDAQAGASGGVSKFNVTNTGQGYFAGNVGIGTTAPTKALQVESANTNGGIAVSVGGTVAATLVRGSGSNGILTLNSGGVQYVNIDANGTSYFNAGNVGIGTTAPLAKLDVVGSANLSINSAYKINTNTILTSDGTNTDVRVANSGATIFSNSSGGELARITNAGNVGIGTTSPGQLLELSALTDATLRLTSTKNAADWAGQSYGGIEFYSNDGSYGGAGVHSSIKALTTDSGGGLNALTFSTAGTDALNTERMRITANGNVGIGTTGPGRLLELSAANPILRITRTVNSNAGWTEFYTGTTQDWLLGERDISDSNFHLYSLGTGADAITVLRASGNVGIGTTAPGAKLDIAGGSILLDTTQSIFGNTAGTGDYGKIELYNGSTGNLTIQNNYAGGSANIIVTPDANFLVSSGNVGIGTTSPGEKLNVVGGSENAFTTDITKVAGVDAQMISTGALDIAFTGDGAAGVANPYTYYGARINNSFVGTDNVGVATNIGLQIDVSGGDNNYGLIVGSGNVGIGTTSPQTKLFVQSDSAATIANILRLVNGGAGTGTGVRIGLSTGTSKDHAFIQSKYVDGTTMHDLEFGVGGSGSTDGTVQMVILGSGNVGIGTTGPGGTLDIGQSVTAASAGTYYTTKFNNTYTGTMNSATPVTSIYGVYNRPNIGIGGTSPQLTNLFVDYVSGNIGIGTTSSVTNLYGLYVANPTTNGGSTITNNYGLYINSQTAGTNNFALYSAGGTNYFSGNVGIGTTSPGYLLDIYNSSGNGIVRMGGTASAYSILNRAANTGRAGVIFQTAGASGIELGLTGNSTNNFYIGNEGHSSDWLTINTTTGNVGIGTTNPTQKLHVEGSSYLNGTVDINNNLLDNVGSIRGISTDFTSIAFSTYNLAFSTRTDVGAAAERFRIEGGAAIDDIYIFNSNFNVNSGQLYVQQSSGNVGIGTTNPGAPLEISAAAGGKIRLTNTGYNYWDINSLFNNTNVDLTFSMTGSEKARFDYLGNLMLGYTTSTGGKLLVNGNVGIGTTSPAGKLEVAGTSWLRGGTTTTGLFVDSSGNIGVGTTAPTALLNLSVGSTATVGQKITLATGATANAFEINSTAGAGGDLFLITAGGNVGIGTTNPGYKFQVVIDASNEGHVDSVGSWARSSDLKLKNNISDLGSQLSNVLSLRPVSYDSNNGTTGHIGFIAQDVEQIYPDFVSTNPNSGLLSLSYESFAPVLAKAIQEQNVKLEALNTKFETNLNFQNLNVQNSLENSNLDISKIVSDFDIRISNLSNSSASQSAEIARLDSLSASSEARLASVSAELAKLREDFFATDSARLNLAVLQGSTLNNLDVATVSGTLTVLGKTTLADLGVTGNLNVGLLSITNLSNSTNSTNLDGTSLETLSGPLSLQTNALANLEIMGGKIIIDTSGNLKVEGTITARAIETEEFRVLGAKTAGSSTLFAGDLVATISAEAASSSARILLTPTSLTNKVLTVIEKRVGEFVVGISSPSTADIKFDWFVIK